MASQQKYLNKLVGKRVLVFGGTSGIGFCVAEAAVEYGAQVIVSSSSADKIRNAIKRLSTSYPDAKDRIFGHPCDLSNPDTLEANIEAAFKFATEDGQKKLDHIVNTTGAPEIGLLADLTPARIIQAQIVRAVAPAVMAKYIPKYTNMTNGSSFTATSGAGVYTPPPAFALSSIGGRGLEGLITSMAVELKPMRANLIVPGSTNTELMDTGIVTPELKAKFEEKTLVGKIAMPEEIAEAYIYVMKDHFITGSVIHTNGGAFLAT